MTHPLVTQIRFTRRQFVLGLDGVSPRDAQHRFEPMNSIAWIIGHMANQENFYWVLFAQNKQLAPELRNLVGTGKPASNPPLEDMWSIWREVTEAADTYLDSLTSEILLTHFIWRGKKLGENIGTLLLRNIYHYWFHLGEALAIRQMLGHRDLPEFVGDISTAPYRPES